MRWFAAVPGDRTDYIAEVALEPGPKGQPGRVSIGMPYRFGNDAPDQFSNFCPVLGTPFWLQLREEQYSSVTAFLLKDDGSRVCTLTSFVNKTCDPDTAGCAVSRSGRHLLVVDSQHVTLWDTARQTIIDSGGGPLLDVRRFLPSNRGSAGSWWITDDLRYVIIEPSASVSNECGSYRMEGPMYMPVGGLQVDLQKSGVIFDRVKGTLSIFPAELDRRRVLDAENVGGELRLLYGSWNWERGITVADASGRLLATRRSQMNSGGSFVRWVPDRSEVWFVDGPATFWLGEQVPSSEATITVWDYEHDVEHAYKLTLKQIRESLSRARD